MYYYIRWIRMTAFVEIIKINVAEKNVPPNGFLLFVFLHLQLNSNIFLRLVLMVKLLKRWTLFNFKYYRFRYDWYMRCQHETLWQDYTCYGIWIVVRDKTNQTPLQCYSRVNYYGCNAHTKKKYINFTFYKDKKLLAAVCFITNN